MALAPNALPELRDIPCNEKLLQEVAKAEEIIDGQLAFMKSFHGKKESIRDTSLDNVGVAMVVTCSLPPTSVAAQWLLRQRYLRAGWDEVEFEPDRDSFYGERMTQVVLVEHKYKGEPRKIVITDDEYVARCNAADKGRPG